MVVFKCTGTITIKTHGIEKIIDIEFLGVYFCYGIENLGVEIFVAIEFLCVEFHGASDFNGTRMDIFNVEYFLCTSVDL